MRAATPLSPHTWPSPLPTAPPAPPLRAVYVDGRAAKTYRPKEKDPEGGWYTDAPGAPPDAPFNEPFYLIL